VGVTADGFEALVVGEELFEDEEQPASPAAATPAPAMPILFNNVRRLT
jgi:hypothetical protein